MVKPNFSPLNTIFEITSTDLQKERHRVRGEHQLKLKMGAEEGEQGTEDINVKVTGQDGSVVHFKIKKNTALMSEEADVCILLPHWHQGLPGAMGVSGCLIRPHYYHYYYYYIRVTSLICST